MRRLSVLLWLVGSLTAGTVAAETPAAGPQPNGQKEAHDEHAREYFRLGTNAYKSGRVEEARQLLTDAWERQKSYDIAATLGQVEMALGNLVHANELFDFCIRNFPPIESDEKLATMRKLRELAMAQVAVVVPQCDCDGAELSVDDIDAVPMPLATPLYLRPGRHVLLLKRGQLASRFEVEAKAGERLAPELKFEERVVNLAPPRLNRVATNQGTGVSRAPTLPLYIGGAIVVLNAAAGIGFKVVANDAADRAAEFRGKLEGGPVSACSGTPSAQDRLICGQLSDSNAEQQKYSSLSLIAAGTAATFAVATAVYWIVAHPGKARLRTVNKSANLAVSPWTGAGDKPTAGFSVRGVF